MTNSFGTDRAKLLSFREKFSTETFALLTIKGARLDNRPAGQGHGSGASGPQLLDTVVRGTLSQFKEAEEIGRAEEYIYLVFSRPAEAVKFALLLRANLQALTEDIGQSVSDRFGIHSGELFTEHAGEVVLDDGLLNRHLNIAVHLANLAEANQILMTGPAFDTARQSFKKDDLKKEDLDKIGPLSWMNHGPYLLSGIEEPLEICEVAEVKKEPIPAPAASEKAQRQAQDNDQTLWGWRAALGQTVPGTTFVLEERTADGRYGEVWVGKDERANQQRMFRFCARKDWVEALKEQENVFQALKKKVGENRNVVGIHAVSLAEPPFYIMTDHVEGKDLKSWAQELGGLTGIPLNSRLELAAQIASALQAAHEAGIVHRFIKPAHILVAGSGVTPKDVQAMLTDFAIGHIGVQEALPQTPVPTNPAPPPPATTATPASADTPKPPQTPPRPEHMYWAPELIAGGTPTAKSDLYALGVVLSQMLLGSLTEALAPDRIKEVVTGLKREKLVPYFNENPLERTMGAGGIAGELRAVIKERENRTTARSKISAKTIAWSLATACVLLGVGVVGYSHYSKVWRAERIAKLAAEEAKAKKLGPGDKVEEMAEPPKEEVAATSPAKVEPLVSADESSDEATSYSVSRKSGHGSTRKHATVKEVESTGAQLFKFLILPIIIVVVIGSVVQNFGPLIVSWFRPQSPLDPPKS